MSTNASKRKRYQYEEDSDEEGATYGRQILPVADLPNNFEGEPMDGMQYLFTVRRDARRLPEITSVPNPYEAPQPSSSTVPSTPNSHSVHPFLPSEAWCLLLERRFRNLRANLNQPTIFVGPTHEPNRRFMPDKKERDLWWAYLEGKPESHWNVSRKSKRKNKKLQGNEARHSGMRAWADDPEQDHMSELIIYESSLLNDEGEVEQVLQVDPTELLPTPCGTPAPPESPFDVRMEPPTSLSSSGSQPDPPTPREPSTKVLKLIDEATALHLLMYFTHWINCHLQEPTPSNFLPKESHARWIFALLTRIDEQISADDMHLLRNLARACLALLQSLIEQRLSPTTHAFQQPTQNPMTERACWILISIIVHVWKQRDLWMDAESMLAKFPAISLS